MNKLQARAPTIHPERPPATLADLAQNLHRNPVR